MNLENLISKYIDGDLSHKEDLFLRELIRKDNISREKFNSSIELHLELKEDADSIIVPENLLRETEDKILMNILNTAQAEPLEAKITKIKLQNNKTNYYRIAYTAAALFLISISSIFEFGKYEKSQSMTSNSAETLNSDVQNVKIKNDIKNSKTMHNSKQTYSLANVEKIENYNIGSNEINQLPTNNLTDNSLIQNNQIVTNEDVNHSETDETKSIIQELTSNNDKNVNSQNLTNLSLQKNTSNLPIRNLGEFKNQNFQLSGSLFDQLGVKNEIRLESYYGRNFAQNGLNSNNKTPITQYSQSISYNMDDVRRIGLEFGITDLVYQRLTKVPVSIDQNKQTFVLDDFGNGDGTQIYVPIYLNQNHQMIWGSLFYEQTLYNNNYLNLDSRLGLGLSSQGSLLFGRVLGKLHLYGSIYFLIGSEGRIFTIDNKYISNSGYSSTLSMIYGFQFKF